MSKLEDFLQQVTSQERRENLFDACLSWPNDNWSKGYSSRDKDVQTLIAMLKKAIKQRGCWIRSDTSLLGWGEDELAIGEADKELEAIAAEGTKNKS